MTTFARTVVATIALLAAAALVTSAPADAKSCFKKAAVGNALTEGLAHFQVDAALLQATDWNIYWTWVASGATPGYTFGRRTYKCAKGDAIGWQCHGQATLCKE